MKRRLGSGPNDIVNVRLPYVLMEEPFAAMRSVVRSACLSLAEAGKTHSSAPESTRKARLEMLSLMEMVPREWPAAAINGRPFRFPMEAARPGASWGR